MNIMERILQLLVDMDKKIENLDKKIEQLTKIKVSNRMNSSTRGLNKQEALMHLHTQTPPSNTFFAWVNQSLQGFVLDMQSDKFEDVVFYFLEKAYKKDDSPVFSVKREKTTYIFDDCGYRVMNENDMKRVILIFQCRAMILLDEWKMEVDQQWCDSDGDNTDDNITRHFQEKRYMMDADKINRLSFEHGEGGILRTLLRKFNTYMLRARGVTFN